MGAIHQSTCNVGQSRELNDLVVWTRNNPEKNLDSTDATDSAYLYRRPLIIVFPHQVPLALADPHPSTERGGLRAVHGLGHGRGLPEDVRDVAGAEGVGHRGTGGSEVLDAG